MNASTQENEFVQAWIDYHAERGIYAMENPRRSAYIGYEAQIYMGDFCDY